MPTQAGYTSVFGKGMREAGSLFGSAIMESMGYENEEKAVDRIIRNADWDTDEGKETALNAVRSISPDGYAELVKQLNETARAEAETANIELQMQTNELASIKALKSGTWATDWQLDAGPTGAAVTLQNWLRANGYKDAEIKEITTTAQAATFLNEKIKTGASGIIKDMYKHMNDSRNMYIDNKMYQTYNERHGIEQPKIDATGAVVNTDENDFDAALTDAGNIDGNATTAVTNGRTSFAGVSPHDLTPKQKAKKRSDITPTNRFSHLKNR
jgi:hypothetical protein